MHKYKHLYTEFITDIYTYMHIHPRIQITKCVHAHIHIHIDKTNGCTHTHKNTCGHEEYTHMQIHKTYAIVHTVTHK